MVEHDKALNVVHESEHSDVEGVEGQSALETQKLLYISGDGSFFVEDVDSSVERFGAVCAGVRVDGGVVRMVGGRVKRW